MPSGPPQPPDAAPLAPLFADQFFFTKPFTDYTTGDFKRLVSTIQIGRELIGSARPRCNQRK